MMRFKKPKKLKAGDDVQVVASSSHFSQKSLLQGIKVLESWDLKVSYQKNIFQKQAYLAGSDERRAQEFIRAMNDPKIKAVFFARGGYGAIRILPFLKPKLFKGCVPKIVIGYSDVSTLLFWIQKELGWVSVYGPTVAADLSMASQRHTKKSLHQVLFSLDEPQSIKYPSMEVIRSGVAQGVLLGGCLSLAAASLGTEHALQTKNVILFLEDVNERPYEIDRMLMHLKLAKKLDSVRGVIFSMKSSEPRTYYKDVLKRVFHDVDVPVVYGFPAGHMAQKTSLPLGVRVELNTQKKQLTYLEKPFCE